MEIRYLEKTIVYGAVKWVAEIIYIVGELSFARYRALYKWSLTLIYCQFFAAFLLLNFIWRKLWYLTLVMIPWDTYFNLKIRESNCHKQHRQNYEHSTPMINIGNICPSFFNFEIKGDASILNFLWKLARKTKAITCLTPVHITSVQVMKLRRTGSVIFVFFFFSDYFR